MIDCFLGDDVGVLSCPFWSTVLHCGARLQITQLQLLEWVDRGAVFLLRMRLRVTLLIVDLWQYYVCCIISGLTLCTHFMILYQYCMRHYGLHEVLWSHIGIPICVSSLQTSHYRLTFIPLSVSLWNKLADQAFDGVGLVGFKGRANPFLLA